MSAYLSGAVGVTSADIVPHIDRRKIVHLQKVNQASLINSQQYDNDDTDPVETRAPEVTRPPGLSYERSTGLYQVI